MKLKWGRRSLTFLIISDANSKVVRLRISSILLYLVPILLLSGLCVTLYVHLENTRTLLEKERLAAELTAKQLQYEKSLNSKEATIAELQGELLDITEQAEDMKLKVNELKQLEAEIRDVTSFAEDGKTQDRTPVSIASSPLSAVGGGSDELGEKDTRALLAMTKEQLSFLDLETDKLIASITKSKDALLEHLRQKRITPSIWPTESYTVSSNFGYRRDPFTRKLAFHSGIDIAGNTGDPVYATAEGVVTYAGYDRGSYGYNVIIKHASGLRTRYGHLKRYTVKEGQIVAQGEKIGELGSTGRSTGPHLHYEVIKNGATIDPKPYMPQGKDEP